MFVNIYGEVSGESHWFEFAHKLIKDVCTDLLDDDIRLMKDGLKNPTRKEIESLARKLESFVNHLNDEWPLDKELRGGDALDLQAVQHKREHALQRLTYDCVEEMSKNRQSEVQRLIARSGSNV